MLLSDTKKTDKVKTTCPYCGVGCGVIAKPNSRGKVNISGDKKHPSNFGRLCSKGSALGETVDLEHRLLHASINKKQCSMDDALNAVAEGFNQTIKKHGSDAVAFYVSGQLLTEDYYVANKLMKGFIGSANIDTNSRLCMSSAVAGHERAFGSDSVGLCYEDLEEAEAIVLIGSNIAWCHPVLFQRIEKIRQERDLKIIVVDPRRTTSCDGADGHLAIKPGTDAVLYNGLLNFLSENNYLDKTYIEQYTNGFDETLKLAKQTSPDIKTVARLCDIEEESVLSFYKLFSETEKVISFFSMGINQSSSGADKVNSIINAHLASAKIGKPGMGAFSITGQPNAMGGREVGGLAGTLAAHMGFSDIETNRVQRFWNSPVIAKKTGLKAVDLFSSIQEGKVKAVWIMATNPVVSIPNADIVQSALEKCELVVVSDCIKNTDTTHYANILLPAQGWGEKSGTVSNSERRISRQRSFLNAAGDAKPDWWMISEVAKRMGFTEGFKFHDEADVFREHAALSGFENNDERAFDISGLADIENEDYDNLKPVQWPVNKANPDGTKRLFTDSQFFTEDKKAKFIPIEPRNPVELLTEDYPLILNTGRIRDHWHTMTRTGKSQRLTRHIKEPFVQCHPNTAEQFNIKDNELVEIESQWGKVLVRADVTERQRKGEIFIPLHWNDQFSAKARVDAVVNPHVDPLSGQPEFKHTPVKIKSIEHNCFGFMLSRREYKLHELAYWSKLREQNNWRYEFSDESLRDLDWFKKIIQDDVDYEWVEYKDGLNESSRYFWFDRSGMQGCIFITNDYENLPEREWLSEQFTELTVDIEQRTRLVVATSGPDRPNSGAIVCSCFNVGKNTINEFINEFKPDNIDVIGKHLKAGTNCGSCKPELKCLLNETETV
ncbi:MAG: nitrate reductase [Proteobacteria bacterium]|nr:nitrate reductase [Pseudomonadota bacterium]NOG59957.1 nitrate reductase [Pseudomonadota bacterium]